MHVPPPAVSFIHWLVVSSQQVIPFSSSGLHSWPLLASQYQFSFQGTPDEGGTIAVLVGEGYIKFSSIETVILEIDTIITL